MCPYIIWHIRSKRYFQLVLFSYITTSMFGYDSIMLDESILPILLFVYYLAMSSLINSLPLVNEIIFTT